MLSQGRTVYVVDADAAIGEALRALLATYEVEVQLFSRAQPLLAAHRAGELTDGCLLIAAQLPDRAGLELVAELRAGEFNLPIIVLAGEDEDDVHHRALSLGAADVIGKPLFSAYLVDRLSQLSPKLIELPDPADNPVTLADGTQIRIRLMRPEDAEIEQQFVRDLSSTSRQFRFFTNFKELPAHILEQFTNPDYPVSYALIATTRVNEQERQIGVARYAPTGDPGVVEFAVVVGDAWQGLGVARRLVAGLTTAAAIAGVEMLEGLVLRENARMLDFTRRLGFTRSDDESDPSVVRVHKMLNCERTLATNRQE